MSQVRVESPVISFRLEGTLLPRETTERTPRTLQALGTEALKGSRETLQAVREVGGRSVVISSLPTGLAHQALEAASLTPHAVHGDIIQMEQGQALAAQLGSVAHVGSRYADISLVETTHARSFIVEADNQRRASFRVRGADHIIASLDSFPDFLNLSKAFIGPTEGSQLLHASTASWANWRRADLMPIDTDLLGYAGVSKAFAESVMAHTQGQRPCTQQLELSKLAWEISNGPATARQTAIARLAELKDQGLILTTRELAAEVGRPPSTVSHWALYGKIPATPISRNFYFLPKDVAQLKKHMRNLTTPQAASLLGLSGHRSVSRLMREGKLPARTGPGHPRLAPDDVHDYLDANEEAWTSRRVEELFNIPRTTLSDWTRAGILCAQKAGRYLHYDEASVLALKAEFDALHPDFDWLTLPPLNMLRGRKRVQTQLNLRNATLGRWTKVGLLPACSRWPTRLRPTNYQYVGDYVDALGIAAGRRSLTRDLATRFKQRCMDAETIVWGPLD